MGREELHTVVIGAGAAGLTAARELSAAGRKVALIEARNRIGGRIFTVRDALSPAPVELGAEFVHGEPPVLLDAIHAAGLTTVEVSGEDMCFYGGKLESCGGPVEELNAVFERLSRHKGPDESFADFIASCDCGAQARASAISFIEGFNAADSARAGVAALARQQNAEDAIHGDRAYRLVEGYGALAEYLLRSARQNFLELHLNALVTEINWRRGRVEVQARRAGRELEPFVAPHAVITVPLGVLQEGAIRFDPEPGGLKECLDRLAMGAATRIVLRFREGFLTRREAPPDLGFLFTDDDWLPTWWTVAPQQAPVITGWAGGPKARRTAGRDPQFVLHRAMEILSRALSIGEGELWDLLDTWRLHDWNNDPFTRGAYSYVPVNALGAVEWLARPIEDTLFFAGEASDTEGHWGTVHAAMTTGLRAARAILAK